MNTNLPDIYTDAAERIHASFDGDGSISADRYCCLAIVSASFAVGTGRLDVTPARDRFAELYEGEALSRGSWFDSAHLEENQEHRVFALLFAAEFYRQ